MTLAPVFTLHGTPRKPEDFAAQDDSWQVPHIGHPKRRTIGIVAKLLLFKSKARGLEIPEPCALFVVYEVRARALMKKQGLESIVLS